MARIFSILRALVVPPVVLTLWLAAATRADAQEHGFVSALGGVTFGTVAGADLAGQAGVGLASNIAVFGEAGQLFNVLPKADQSAINGNATAVALAMAAGNPSVSGRLPAIYGVGGVRVSVPIGRLTAFGEAALGAARLTSGLKAVDDNLDISAQVFTTPLTMSLPGTDLMTTFGGGVSYAATKRASLEVGYRLSHISASAEPINTNRLYGGARLSF